MASGGCKGESTSDQIRGEDTFKANKINIVLVGRTGSGKSALANNVLKKEIFQSYPSPVSVTSTIEIGKTNRMGYEITVVDTPGFKHTALRPNEVERQIKQAVDSLKPGPHAILYVGRVGRYSDEEHLAMKDFEKIMGEDVFNYTIFFLSCNDLIGKQENADQYLDRLPAFFRRFVERCGGRKIMFNNLAYGSDSDEQNAKLFSMIEMMRRKNSQPYFSRHESNLHRIVKGFFGLSPFITKRNIVLTFIGLVTIYQLMKHVFV